MLDVLALFWWGTQPCQEITAPALICFALYVYSYLAVASNFDLRGETYVLMFSLWGRRRLSMGTLRSVGRLCDYYLSAVEIYWALYVGDTLQDLIQGRNVSSH